MNKQESSSKLFSQFSPAPVRSVVPLTFSKRCLYFARLLPSPCAGLQLVTRTSHRKEEYYLNPYFSEILPTRRSTLAWQYQKYLVLPSWLKVYVSICKVYWKFCYKVRCIKVFGHLKYLLKIITLTSCRNRSVLLQTHTKQQDKEYMYINVLFPSCHHGDSFFLEKLLTVLSDDREKLTNVHTNSLLFNNKKLMISSFGNMYELHNFNLPSVF